MQIGNFGLGLRKKIVSALLEEQHPIISFLEVVPENWMNIGGYWKKQLDLLAEQYQFIAHGISLSLGSHNPLNIEKLKQIKAFMDQYEIEEFSEHLCFSEYDNIHLFELLPLPFTQDAINLLVAKIDQAQDFLGRPMILENVCYYANIEQEMTEEEFIGEIVKRTGCKLLLDINNIYINAKNHQYNPIEMLQNLPLNQVAYLHLAGHQVLEDGFIIDSHKDAISQEVYDLLDYIYPIIDKDVPVLLERDGNFNGVSPLVEELHKIRDIVQGYQLTEHLKHSPSVQSTNSSK